MPKASSSQARRVGSILQASGKLVMRHIGAVSSLVVLFSEAHAFQAPLLPPLGRNFGTPRRDNVAFKPMTSCFAASGMYLGLQHLFEIHSHEGRRGLRHLRGATMNAEPRKVVTGGDQAASKRKDNPLRPFFDKALRSKENIICTERDVHRFFEAMGNFGDASELLYRLDDRRERGHECLKNSFSMAFASSSDKALLNSAVAFLAKLGDRELNRGTMIQCVEDCFKSIYTTPGLPSALLEAMEASRITDLSAVAWFLVSVCKKDAKAREDPKILEMAQLLRSAAENSQDGAISHLANLLPQEDVDNSSSFTHDDMQAQSLSDARLLRPLPGGRHDNDYADYRKISILPTASEMNSTTESYLPLVREPHVGKTLERQFRLLREDMVSSLKDQYKSALQDGRGVYMHPRFVNASRARERGFACVYARMDVFTFVK
jgi:hypothetical protein